MRDINSNTQHSGSSNGLQGHFASSKTCVESYEGATTHTPISSNSPQTLLFLHVVVNFLKKRTKMYHAGLCSVLAQHSTKLILKYSQFFLSQTPLLGTAQFRC